jgi:hypothetical protein
MVVVVIVVVVIVMIVVVVWRGHLVPRRGAAPWRETPPRRRRGEGFADPHCCDPE